MSIYRKFAPDTRNDVYATAIAPKVTAPDPVAVAREEAEQAKKRRGEPMNAPLPRTLQWAAHLRADVRPEQLLRLYGRIANNLAALWGQPDAMYAYFDELLHDRRGHRKGFPPDVMAELLALRTYYAGVHPQTAASWADVTKR
jgi:hypothetical protein